jgi:predicted nuclease with TOPRIM domain
MESVKEILTHEELIRERDFYRAKLVESNTRIKSLEFDNAELVKRDQLTTKRISELANKSSNRPRFNKRK